MTKLTVFCFLMSFAFAGCATSGSIAMNDEKSMRAPASDGPSNILCNFSVDSTSKDASAAIQNGYGQIYQDNRLRSKDGYVCEAAFEAGNPHGEGTLQVHITDPKGNKYSAVTSFWEKSPHVKTSATATFEEKGAIECDCSLK